MCYLCATKCKFNCFYNVVGYCKYNDATTKDQPTKCDPKDCNCEQEREIPEEEPKVRTFSQEGKRNMGAIIELPSAIIKKLDNTENLPYQWFGEVWKLMNSNRLDLSDDIIQDIFIAQGKGKQAQKDFYLKYGECKYEAQIPTPECEEDEGDHEVWKRGKHEVWDEEFFTKRKKQKTGSIEWFIKAIAFGITSIIMLMLLALIIIR